MSSTICCANSLHSQVVNAWANAKGLYNLNAAEIQQDHGNHGAQNTRRVNWAAVMGGAYVMVLRWDIANTSTSELEQAGYIVRFMEKTRINKMAPDDSRAVGSTDWLLVEAPSQSFVAYTNNASGPMGVRNMEGGVYDLTWLDTVTGSTVNQSGVAVGAGINTFPVPGGISSPEIALYIHKAGL